MAEASYEAELRAAASAAESAAAILRPEFFRQGGPVGSEGHADVDTLAERAILDVLTNAFPAYGYLGEELGAVRAPDSAGHLWAVDPNDGTIAFLASFRGSSVSISLLKNGEPVLGVVHGYCPPIGERDVFLWAKGCGPVTRNGAAVKRTWDSEPLSCGTALLTQYSDRNPDVRAHAIAPLRYRAIPSIAYRMALVAAGEGEVAISGVCPHVWDCAAGQALLIGAGANLYDARGQVVTYSATGEMNCEGGVFGGSRRAATHAIERYRNRPTAPPRPAKPRRLFWPVRGQPVTNTNAVTRAQGCMLGQLAGDSLGSLVEFLGPQEIARAYPNGVRRLEDGGAWRTIAGQPTDDSEMALALARTMIDCGRYIEEEVARAYVEWYRSRPFDIGSTTRAALAGASDAMHGRRSALEGARRAANHSSQANGALMRVSPIGIFGAGAARMEDVIKWASADAAITHPHRVCRESNGIFAAAIAYAIRSAAPATEVHAQALAFARGMNACEPVYRAIEQAAHEPPADYTTQPGWVLIALQNAFYQMLHAATFEQGVVDTVTRGGDTDTNAAVAGALLGAIHGSTAAPRQWVDRVLTCRPLDDLPGVERPRPEAYWPTEALYIAERLLFAGGVR
jgi:ADP-ribosyl-[dinitrogen reductase] hydrolase